MGVEFVQDLDQRKRPPAENRSPSRPNSLELQNNMVPYLNEQEQANSHSLSQQQQQYLQQQGVKPQEPVYGRANGPVQQGGPPAHITNNNTQYPQAPAYGNHHNHHPDPNQPYEANQLMYDPSSQLASGKRNLGGSRSTSIVNSPRPSQPPPAPPASMGNNSGNSSRESLPPPPPPPLHDQMANMNMRNNSPITTPLHLSNVPAGLRDSPVRQKEMSHSPMLAHTKGSTPDSMDLPPPPPPPPDTHTPDTPSSMASMPPPPPTPPLPDLHNGAPPPPPPPPLPVPGNELVMKQSAPDNLANGGIPTAVPSVLDEVSVVSSTSSATGSSGSTLPVEDSDKAVRDERSDLLCAIRDGEFRFFPVSMRFLWSDINDTGLCRASVVDVGPALSQ